MRERPQLLQFTPRLAPELFVVSLFIHMVTLPISRGLFIIQAIHLQPGSHRPIMLSGLFMHCIGVLLNLLV